MPARPQLLPQGFPKRCSLWRVWKPCGSQLGVPREGEAPVGPCPECPQAGLGEGRGRADDALAADAEQVGFLMVIGPSGEETATSLFQGEQGRASARGWGSREGHPGVLGAPWGAAGSWAAWGPPSLGGYPQVCPCPERNSKGILLFPRVLHPCGTSSAHPCVPCWGSQSPQPHFLCPQGWQGSRTTASVCHPCATLSHVCWGLYHAASTRLLAVIRPQPAAPVRLSWRGWKYWDG